MLLKVMWKFALFWLRYEDFDRRLDVRHHKMARNFRYIEFKLNL